MLYIYIGVRYIQSERSIRRGGRNPVYGGRTGAGDGGGGG